MSQQERNVMIGVAAGVVSAITGGAAVLGILFGAGFGVVFLNASLALLTGYIARIELGGAE